MVLKVVFVRRISWVLIFLAKKKPLGGGFLKTIPSNKPKVAILYAQKSHSNTMRRYLHRYDNVH